MVVNEGHCEEKFYPDWPVQNVTDLKNGSTLDGHHTPKSPLLRDSARSGCSCGGVF